MACAECYPVSFERKIGFFELRTSLSELCSCSTAREKVEQLYPETDPAVVLRYLSETAEMKRLITEDTALPSFNLVDIRPTLKRIKPIGASPDASELHDILLTMQTTEDLHSYFHAPDRKVTYPLLAAILEDCILHPLLSKKVAHLFDADGQIADNASPNLLRIRRESDEIDRSTGRLLDRLLRHARKEGWVDAEAQPTLHNGHLTLPVIPACKKSVHGIVQGVSTTGRTIFIEPMELVEAGNRMRELENEERREILRIIAAVTDDLRPVADDIAFMLELTGYFDFVRAKAYFAIHFGGELPRLTPEPRIEWIGATHPLLIKSLAETGRKVVPLDISLHTPENRILLISGPNAGGKSICLKTVAVNQYMLQCGMLPVISADSTTGIFTRLGIDIGDEQSIEDDLSTYSSHLRNMKAFIHLAGSKTLLLIDEFGSGTEPQIGGAIAEALLEEFNRKDVFGIITTHYHNLKLFADKHLGIINGAMLYDRHLMQPLFRLSIGRPGSSFAIEIARKTGLPSEVINRAGEIVGKDYISMDKYLQDIIRDKRYWEQKREKIRQQEKEYSSQVARYTEKLETIDSDRKRIRQEAEIEAGNLLKETRKRIEKTIRTIKEAEAERERTRQARAELEEFGHNIRANTTAEKIQQKQQNDKYSRELAKLQRRQANKNRNKEKLFLPNNDTRTETEPDKQVSRQPIVGEIVSIEGQMSSGVILELNKKDAVVAIGNLKLTIPLKRLQKASAPIIAEHKRKSQQAKEKATALTGSITDYIREKRLDFKTDLDVRGMRAIDALTAVSFFIDDAYQLGLTRVRILHGTGSGALREAICKYLAERRELKSFHDEDIRFGGTGITVAEL